ncbi:MAG: hypothetical protein CFH34_00594 [Alphaproteobacteria bacterium MarineAlpha9_Bin4]|nr:tol-pal system protein YbgF [Pelagibacterales bacterium]PPR26961.1 MAG: hypothetical protein CFH34_00594 [Alphaproteobacteria bacterium MarineAlpha9_Bin4]
MPIKNLLFYSLVFFVFFSKPKLSIVYAEEYLNTVIEKINKMEKDLEKLQKDSISVENSNTLVSSTNTIASHEKRLIDLEEELRALNGKIDEVFYELKNISNDLKDIKSVNNSKNTRQPDTLQEESVNVFEKEKNSETITSEDPNMEKNPSMKVLGVIKNNESEEPVKETNDDNNMSQNDSKDNIKEPDNLISQKESSISESQLEELSKNPSDIYKLAYNMLIQENFSEAEKYFNIFLGENPDDPLASNAYYWLGETFYVQKQFQKAAISFAKGYKKFPKGNKAIDQVFKLALTFVNLGKNEDACAAFSKLELEFPNASKRIKNRAKEYKISAKC